MSLRITTNMMISQSLRDINDNLKHLQDLQRQISTGKRILKPSDDPIGTSKSIRYKADLDRNTTYQSNIRDGLNRLKATSQVLESISEMILDIQAIIDEGLDINASLERGTLSTSLNGYLNEILLNANAKFQGKFLFGGIETLSGTTPYSAPFNPVYDSQGVMISGVVQNVEGISDLIRYEIAEGYYSPVNISGSAPFQPNGRNGVNDIFSTIINLRDAFRSNNLQTARSELEKLQKEYDNINSQATLVGSRINELERQAATQVNLGTNLKEQLSSVLEVDIAKAIMEESYQQYLYNASLQVGARIIPQSLLDFLG